MPQAQDEFSLKVRPCEEFNPQNNRSKELRARCSVVGRYFVIAVDPINNFFWCGRGLLLVILGLGRGNATRTDIIPVNTARSATSNVLYFPGNSNYSLCWWQFNFLRSPVLLSWPGVFSEIPVLEPQTSLISW